MFGASRSGAPVVVCWWRLLADAPALFDVRLPLLGRLLALACVSRWELELLLGGDPGLQLPAALELGIHFGAEEQGEIRDPDPQEEHDHTADRAVGLVVAREVRDIDAE